MKNKTIIYSLLFIIFIKSINIGKRTFVSDLRLPGIIDIIFLFFHIKLLISVLILVFIFQLMDVQQKYFLYFPHQNIFFQNQIIIKYDLKIF